jgi:(p)ppGpp synthase/HD superfamily hydrolase
LAVSPDGAAVAPDAQSLAAERFGADPADACRRCMPVAGDVVTGVACADGHVTVHLAGCPELRKHRATDEVSVDWSDRIDDAIASTPAYISEIQVLPS